MSTITDVLQLLKMGIDIAVGLIGLNHFQKNLGNVYTPVKL